MFHKTTFFNKVIIIFICFFSLNIVSEVITLDGVISLDEWNQSTQFDLEYEVMPSRNTAAGLKTTAYVQFDKKYLYIGIKAYGDPNKIFKLFLLHSKIFQQKPAMHAKGMKKLF